MKKRQANAQEQALEEGRRWLRQAEEDLETATLLFDKERFDWTGFVCQQAAVKAAKAFLYAQGREKVTGESVVSLCESAAEEDPGFAELTEVVKNLDQFHFTARFPDALPDGIPAEFFDRRDGEGALEMARALFGAVKGRLERSL